MDARLPVFAGPPEVLAWSPVARDELAVGTTDGQILIRRTDDTVVNGWMAHAGRVRSIAYSPSGASLVSSSDGGSVRVWDVESGSILFELEHGSGLVAAVAFSPDGATLASGGNDRTIRIWDSTSGELRRELTGHSSAVATLAYSPDGTTIASAGTDGTTVRLWDTRKGEQTGELAGHTSAIAAVAYAPDGTTLATAGDDGTVRIWDIASGKPRSELNVRHTRAIATIVYAPDGSTLATGSDDGTVRIWDPTTGEQRTELTGHTGWQAVAYHPDGSTLATASDDGTVRIWDPTTGEQHTELTGHTGKLLAVAYAPDGATLATGSIDGTVRIWDPTTGEQRTELPRHTTGPVFAVAYHPDGTNLATVGVGATVCIWDPTTGEQRTELTGHTGAVRAVAYNPDGTTLATAGDDHTVRIWDPTTGEQRTELTGHTNWVWAVAYHPDGTTLATAGVDGTVRIWDPTTGEQRTELTGHTGWQAVAYHPDGTTLATAGVDGTVRIWDPTNGEQRTELTGHTGPAWAVAYHPDGTNLATAGVDGTVRIWSQATGEQQVELKGHTGWARAVAYAPGGITLASAGHDGTVRIWDPTTGEQRARLPRPWSPDGSDPSDLPPAPPTPTATDSVQQVLDRATVEDQLGRTNLAGGLAGQLLELHKRHPKESFAVLVAGAWGSGKSSLANLMLAALDEQPDAKGWIRPRPNQFFDAWRESQIGPAWWSLLTWLRATVLDRRETRRARAWFRLREILHRFRLAGLLIPTVVIALVVGVVVGYVVIRASRDNQLAVTDALLGLVGATVSTIATIGALGKVLSRWLTFRTPAGAKLFERRDDNPMEDVIRHSQWLRRQVDGPILLIIDDLDRCPAKFVVDLLEAVQTLLRPISTRYDEDVQPLVIVVCADDRWIHTAYEQAYTEFAAGLARPGRSLGQLFLAKLFQLQLRVPEIDADTAVEFSRHRLGLTKSARSVDERATREHDAPAPRMSVATAKARVAQATSLDDKVDALRDVDSTDVRAKLGLAVDVGRSAASAEGQADLRHHLEAYVPMLDREPRAVVRFLNAYALAKMGVGSLPHPPTNDALARWTIIELRWPSVARRLVAQPTLLDRWHENGIGDDEHADVLGSATFRQVVLDAEGTEPVLRSEDVVRCVGVFTPDA